MRWAIGILALSVCSAVTVGAQVGAGLIPVTSLTTWAPGVRGIPARTAVCATVNAATYGNGAQDASAGIQAAIDACPVGQVVQLSPGVFTVNNHVRIGKSITLRGAAPRVTTLQKTNSSDEQEQIIIVGPSRWPHLDETTAVNLAADAVQGAMSVTVQNSAGFAPGQFVKLDEDDYSTATWMALPPRISEPSPQILATDRVVWPIRNPSQQGDLPLPSGLSWFSRPGRPLAEIKEVTAVSGNTITFSTPVHITYTTAKLAQLVRYTGTDSVHVRNAGVEEMTLTGGSDGNLSFSSAAYSWAKHVECARYTNPCIDLRHGFRVEIRDSHIHDALNPYPGGAGYALSLSHGESEALVENNIIVGANKLMVVRSAGAGSVVGYNYVDNAFIGNYPGWVEVGINGSHMLGSHHMLFEGNLSFNYDSDDTWGGAIAMTVFRNHLTGRRRDFPDNDNVRTAGLMFGSWWHTFAGNVLGEAGRVDGWIYEDPGDGTYGHSSSKWGNRPTIWKLGYAPGAWPQGPDPKVRSTVAREGNFDFLTNSVRWDHGPQALPDSLYLTAKPAFFGDLPWPWVDPTGATKVWTLPARVRFESTPPAQVTGLRVRVP
jgi:Pectate lyase superfamily protein